MSNVIDEIVVPPETVVIDEIVVPPEIVVIDEIVIPPETVSPESVKEPSPEKNKSKAEMNLTEIWMDFLGADSKKIELTPKLKQMIVLLPLVTRNENTKNHLENMEVLFAKIVEDKKINVADVGEIIELLKEMYIVYDTMRISVTTEEVGKVFKVLAQVFIQYKLGNQIPDDEKELIISSINTIITLCIQMIDLKETRKKLKKQFICFSCF